ncbi:OB-fold nucleic acid binding domain-containing protein [Prevotella sp. OH937_COT-195]|uniref:OB-fold nucleic acid binding domain-containing protein n=1 Tax=Prevotella sp. OH937_COT-195 TaxID=2491051 RepID=UPI000F646627|nr:OB-fold nucleic acid binding domain-containing protein [Prevotella sp. OH937_COT-195]RRD02726.1 hypothetical protein EII32_01565 [Prevotella sp. OH937_COT-195]
MKKIIYSVIMLAIATFTMTSCEDVPAPYGFPEENGNNAETPLDEPTGSGTEADPYNVAAALKMIKAMSKDDISPEVFVKGKISSIDGVNLQFGNATYSISDNGTTNNQLVVFRGLFLGGEKFKKEDQIKVGDEVIIKGKCKNFKGNTPEFDAGSVIFSLNGEKAQKPEKPNTKFDPTGTGKINDPYNVAAVLQTFYEIESGQESENEIYVKGKIVGTPQIDIAQYGNATYKIAQDGSEDDDKLVVFRGLDIDKKKFTDAAKIKEGDEVVVCGKVTKYNGAIQLAKNNYLVSINGSQGSGIKKTIEGNILTIDDTSLSELENTTPVTIDLGTQGWADKQNTNLNIENSDFSITFEKGNGDFPPTYYESTKGVRMYAKNLFNINEKTHKIKKIVLECEAKEDKIYTGNTQLTAVKKDKKMTVCNEFSSTKGGDQLRVKKITITYGK